MDGPFSELEKINILDMFDGHTEQQQRALIEVENQETDVLIS